MATDALVARPRSAASSSGAAPNPNRFVEYATDSRVRSRVNTARQVSRAAVTVSAALVAGAASVAQGLGRAASEMFWGTDYGARLKRQKETERGKAVQKVAASSLAAFADVWDGLERAARVFGRHVADSTQDFVTHRYGPDAGETARNTLHVAGDVGEVALSLRQLGLGGMVRRTAAETARHIVNHQAEHALQQPPPAGAYDEANRLMVVPDRSTMTVLEETRLSSTGRETGGGGGTIG
jgi:hypothetical protein